MTAPGPHQYHDHDAAKRFRDDLWLHQSMLTRDEILAARYMAVSMLDGSSDRVVYDNRDDAVRSQRSHVDGNRVIYFRIPLERLSDRVTDSLLWYGRRAYDAGYRPVGSDERSELHVPSRWEALLDNQGRPRL